MSGDNKLLGACTIDGDIGIIDITSLKYINKLKMHDLPVQACAFSSENDLLMTGSVDYRIGYIAPVKRSALNLTSTLAILAVLLVALVLGYFFRS